MMDIQELMGELVRLQLENKAELKLEGDPFIIQNYNGYGRAMFDVISWVTGKGWLPEPEEIRDE